MPLARGLDIILKTESTKAGGQKREAEDDAAEAPGCTSGRREVPPAWWGVGGAAAEGWSDH